MNSKTIVRKLLKEDLQAFFNLRLEALKNFPSGFLSTYAEEKAAGPVLFENLLSNQEAGNVIFGAVLDGKLIGCLGIYQKNQATIQHISTIWGMYVQPDYRNSGVGKALLTVALEHAKNELKCQVVNLSVDADNISAIKLYESFGFKSWGMEPKAKMMSGRFFDTLHMALLF